MSKFLNYINEKTKMQTTMIGFRVDESKIQNLVDYIESWLIRYKVPYDHIETKHISVAQITDKARKDELVRLVNKISTSYIFNAKKVTVLYGKEWDFLSLELNRSKDFINLYEKIKQEYNVVQFPGGVRPHISIIKIQKGIASDEFLADVIRKAPMPKKVKAKKVDLWSPKFTIMYTKNK